MGPLSGPALDLRRLSPPEPFERALAAVDALGAGERLRLLTPMVPVPLLEVLALRGFAAEVEPLDGGGARVDVFRTPTAASRPDGPP